MKKALIFLLVLLLSCCTNCDRHHCAGSDEQHTAQDSALDLASSYYKQGKANRLFSLLNTLRPEASVMNQSTYQRYLHIWHLYYAQYNNNPDSMLYYGQKAKEHAILLGDYSKEVLSMSNLADTYRQRGDLELAIQEYTSAIRLNDSIHADSSLYLPMYSGMACCFNFLHNKRETDHWLGRMLSMSRYMTTIDSISYFTMKGNSLYFAEKYSESLREFLRLDSLLKCHPELTFDRQICNVNLADNYIHMHREKDVDGLLDGALRYFESKGITTYSPYVHTLQILQLLGMQKTDQALALMKATMNDIPTMNPDYLVQRYKAMGLCMDKAGNVNQALRYNQIYTELQDSIRSAQIIATTAEVEKRYERDARLREQQMQLAQKELNETRLYLAITILLLLIGIMVAISVQHIRKARRMHQQAVNKIISLRGEIIRNRITPHFISNALALGHNLSQEEIDSIIMLIRESLTYSDDLTVTMDRELVFVRSYVNVARTTYRGKLDMNASVDEGIDTTRISLPAMCLISIVENAIKHGIPDEDGTLRISIAVCKAKDKANGAVSVTVTNRGSFSDYNANHDNAWHGLKMISQIVALLNQKQKGTYTFTFGNTPNNHVQAQLIIAQNS